MNEKAIEGLTNASPQKRYKSFLNMVTDLEQVWLLTSQNNYMRVEVNGEMYIALWPQEEFCKSSISCKEKPVSMDVHEFVDKCEKLEPTTCFAVFPTKKNAYIVTVLQLCSDIKVHLEELE